MAGGISLDFLVQNNRDMDSIKDAVLDNIGNAIPNAIKKVGDAILEQANTMVPVETGALRDSGRVELEGGGLDSEVSVAYGDSEEVFYATIVHERLDVHHPVGQAKWLETAYLMMLPSLPELFNAEFIADLRLDV